LTCPKNVRGFHSLMGFDSEGFDGGFERRA
jgi:hypothetical protein